MTRLRVRGDEGDEENAFLDVAADLFVPLVAVLKSAFLVKPHFDAARPERLADEPRRLGILRSVADEDRAGHRTRRCHARWGRASTNPAGLARGAGAVIRLPRAIMGGHARTIALSHRLAPERRRCAMPGPGGRARALHHSVAAATVTRIGASFPFCHRSEIPPLRSRVAFAA